VPGFEEGGAVDVSCGLNHTAVITTAGDLMTFGNGGYFKLGHGGKANISTPTVVEVLHAHTHLLYINNVHVRGFGCQVCSSVLTRC
jgi:alpha-tubulin suppressor-like RCC1 family protein